MLTNRLDVPVRSLFASLLPDERRNDSHFVWLSNFDAERFWASSSAIKIPSLTQPDDQAMVNRLEEMTLLLAEDPDQAFGIFLTAQFPHEGVDTL